MKTLKIDSVIAKCYACTEIGNYLIFQHEFKVSPDNNVKIVFGNVWHALSKGVPRHLKNKKVLAVVKRKDPLTKQMVELTGTRSARESELYTTFVFFNEQIEIFQSSLIHTPYVEPVEKNKIWIYRIIDKCKSDFHSGITALDGGKFIEIVKSICNTLRDASDVESGQKYIHESNQS